jgi:hypothetical protein
VPMLSVTCIMKPLMGPMNCLSQHSVSGIEQGPGFKIKVTAETGNPLADVVFETTMRSMVLG